MGNKERTKIILYLESAISVAVLIGTILAFVSPKTMETYVKYASPEYESFLQEKTRSESDKVSQLRIISVVSLIIEIILTVLLYQGYLRQHRTLLLAWIIFHAVSLLLGSLHLVSLLFAMAVLESFTTIAFYIYRIWTIHVVLNFRKDILQISKEIYEMEVNVHQSNGEDYTQVY